MLMTCLTVFICFPAAFMERQLFKQPFRDETFKLFSNKCSRCTFTGRPLPFFGYYHSLFGAGGTWAASPVSCPSLRIDLKCFQLVRSNWSSSVNDLVSLRPAWRRSTSWTSGCRLQRGRGPCRLCRCSLPPSGGSACPSYSRT